MLQEDFECLDVSIWDQLQEENTSTIWRDALYSVGLNKLLQDTKPGEALFVPADSSLIGQCSAEDALLCATQRLDWYKYLTNTTGVGLLMLHWIPGGWLNSGIFPGDILLLGPNGTFDTGVQTQLTINLLKQNPGTKWHMGYGNNGTRVSFFLFILGPAIVVLLDHSMHLFRQDSKKVSTYYTFD